jgi:PST family polysaccharide transporter
MKSDFFKSNSIYIKNVFFLFFDSISKLILGFVISVFIARHLGPGRFGQINYVLSYVSIFQIIVLFGFDNIVIKDLGLCLYPELNIIGTVIKCRLALAVIVYFFGFLLFFFIDRSLLMLYSILALQLFSSAFLILKQWFQIKSLNKFVVISSQISLLLVSIGKIVFVIITSNVFVYAIILAAGSMIEIFLLYTFFLKKTNIIAIKNFDFTYCRTLFQNSFPLLLSGLSVIILMKGSQILIGNMLSPSELGIYSIGLTIGELVFFIPTSIITAMYPKISKARKENGNSDDLIVRTSGISVFICFLFALFCTFVMPTLIKIVYGDAYLDAGKIVQICGWVGVFLAIGTNHSCFLIFENLQKYDLYAAVMGAGVNIILGYFLIKQIGISGVAVAFLIAHICTNYLFFGLFKDKRSFILRTKSLIFLFNFKGIFTMGKRLWMR